MLTLTIIFSIIYLSSAVRVLGTPFRSAIEYALRLQVVVGTPIALYLYASDAYYFEDYGTYIGYWLAAYFGMSGVTGLLRGIFK